MSLTFSAHPLSRPSRHPLLVPVARLPYSQQEQSSCAFIALAVGVFLASGGAFENSSIASVWFAAERLHARVSRSTTDPKAVAELYYKRARLLRSIHAALTPLGGWPAVVASHFKEAGHVPLAAAVLEGISAVGCSNGFLTLTTQGHTVLLFLGPRGTDGKCRQLFLVNGIGSMLQLAGNTGSGQGYVICIEGGDSKFFEKQLAAVLDWQYLDRHSTNPAWLNMQNAKAASKQLEVQVDVFQGECC